MDLFCYILFVLHNITVSCSLERKIIELQKTYVGVFHIKRKMKEQETKHFRLDERGVLWTEWLYQRTVSLEIKF